MIKAKRTLILAITITAPFVLATPEAFVSSHDSGADPWAMTIGVAWHC